MLKKNQKMFIEKNHISKIYFWLGIFLASVFLCLEFDGAKGEQRPTVY